MGSSQDDGCIALTRSEPLSTSRYQRLTTRQRYAALGGLAIAAGLVSALLWLTRAQAAVQPVVIALVVCVVLLHRTMRGRWERDTVVIAIASMIGLVFFFGLAVDMPDDLAWPALTVGGLLVLASLVVNLALCAYKEYESEVV